MYIHYEDAAPEYTLKVGIGGAAVTVCNALSSFAMAYSSTGFEMSAATLELIDETGRKLASDAVLPAGLPADADVFVRSSAAPTPMAEDIAAMAAAAAKAAFLSAARPNATSGASGSTPAAPVAVLSEEERRQKGVYAKAGSAAAASQAKFGENSYYYSVGKNRPADPTGVVTPAVPLQPPKPKAVSVKPQTLSEVSITAYAMIDDEKVIKVQVPFAGASGLAEGAISCAFRERSFDLRVAHEGKQLRLHIPLLCQEIDAPACVVKKRAGKLLIVLAKKDLDQPWYELRKTKGVGDSEYNKLKPDNGEATMFTL